MLIGALVGEGQRIPWGYAVAYRDFDRDAKIAYPIPLNFFARWARDLRFWLMTVGRPGYRERIEHERYAKGLLDGATQERRMGEYERLRQYERGWQGCAEHMLVEFDRRFGNRDSSTT